MDRKGKATTKRKPIRVEYKKEVRTSTEATADSLSTTEKEPAFKLEVVPLPNVFFSIKDLTKMLKVSRSMIVYYIGIKKLPYYAVGRRKLFTSEHVEVLVERISRGELAGGIERSGK